MNTRRSFLRGLLAAPLAAAVAPAVAKESELVPEIRSGLLQVESLEIDRANQIIYYTNTGGTDWMTVDYERMAVKYPGTELWIGKDGQPLRLR